jgi:hypothetical protein
MATIDGGKLPGDVAARRIEGRGNIHEQADRAAGIDARVVHLPASRDMDNEVAEGEIAELERGPVEFRIQLFGDDDDLSRRAPDFARFSATKAQCAIPGKSSQSPARTLGRSIRRMTLSVVPS